MSTPYDAIIAELANNSLVVLADQDGAQVCAKLRGATADEIGLILGAAQAGVDRQINLLRKHIRQQAGAEGIAAFEAGLIVGRHKAPDKEDHMVREVKRP